MKSLRIIVAHNSYRERGGEDAVVDAEIALLRGNGHDVTEYRHDNSTLAKLPQWELLQKTLWSRAAAQEFSVMLRAVSPDVVHVHNTFPLLSPAIYWASSSAGVPVVQTLHNFRLLCAQAMFLRNGRVCEDCLGRLPWRGVARKCYRDSSTQSAALVGMLALHRGLRTYRRKVSRYIALSQFSRGKFIEGGLPDHMIAVKPNFVSPQSEGHGERKGCLFVGRLSTEKGLHVLANALEILPDATCDVIGTGPQMHLLAGKSRVRLLGQQSEAAVLEAMHKAAYLVMPSICYEQFPRALVEAFACGLPVIASRLGPLAELIEHGRTGLLFEPGSAGDLADKLQFAASAPQAMRQMGDNARAEYAAKYTPQRNHDQLMEVYSAAMHH